MIALAAAIGGLALWLAWFGLGNVTVYEVSRQARLESNSAPRDVSALQPGRLSVSHLDIGREVKTGDVLVELDSEVEELRLQEEQQRALSNPGKIEALRKQIDALKQAAANDKRSTEAAMQSAQAHVEETSAAADFATDNEQRMRKQSETGSVAKIDALRAATEARKAASQRDALVSDVRKLGLDAQTRARQYEAQIEDLRRTLATLESDSQASAATISRLKVDIENHRVRAPVDGVIGEALPLHAGAYVAQGEKLATIVPNGELVIVAEFNPATAMGRVKPGQTARLRLDGFPWAQYGTVDAKVVRVSSEIRENAIRVELAPVSNPESSLVLGHGLTGSVEVGIEDVSPAVLLLRAAGQMIGGSPRAPLQTAEARR